jgi:hypothetical protein
MKGKEIITQINSEKMPDLEQVREKCVNTPPRPIRMSLLPLYAGLAVAVAVMLVFGTFVWRETPVGTIINGTDGEYSATVNGVGIREVELRELRLAVVGGGWADNDYTKDLQSSDLVVIGEFVGGVTAITRKDGSYFSHLDSFNLRDVQILEVLQGNKQVGDIIRFGQSYYVNYERGVLITNHDSYFPFNEGDRWIFVLNQNIPETHVLHDNDMITSHRPRNVTEREPTVSNTYWGSRFPIPDEQLIKTADEYAKEVTERDKWLRDNFESYGRKGRRTVKTQRGAWYRLTHDEGELFDLFTEKSREAIEQIDHVKLGMFLKDEFDFYVYDQIIKQFELQPQKWENPGQSNDRGLLDIIERQNEQLRLEREAEEQKKHLSWLRSYKIEHDITEVVTPEVFGGGYGKNPTLELLIQASDIAVIGQFTENAEVGSENTRGSLRVIEVLLGDVEIDDVIPIIQYYTFDNQNERGAIISRDGLTPIVKGDKWIYFLRYNQFEQAYETAGVAHSRYPVTDKNTWIHVRRGDYDNVWTGDLGVFERSRFDFVMFAEIIKRFEIEDGDKWFNPSYRLNQYLSELFESQQQN